MSMKLVGIDFSWRFRSMKLVGIDSSRRFRSTRAIRATAAALAIATVFAAAPACGQPEFTYVKNSGEKTYFKVPHEWHQISERDLDEVVIAAPIQSATADLLRQRSWNAGYDAAEEPSAGHLYSGQTTDEPIAYVQVLQLDDDEQQSVSLDMLRDLFLPVTQGARQAAQTGGSPLGFFELVHDELLTPSDNLHGVRVVYNYQLPNGVLHTFDMTALVNNATDHIYMLLIRCSTRCYRDRAGELNTIATSFTVRNRS
jgi:hypothetical protein